jgi:hypothetical protein
MGYRTVRPVEWRLTSGRVAVEKQDDSCFEFFEGLCYNCFTCYRFTVVERDPFRGVDQKPGFFGPLVNGHVESSRRGNFAGCFGLVE